MNPQPSFEPYIPDRLPQAEKILRWLQSGRSLTPIEALDRFGCLRLGGRIYDLRKQGHDIKAEDFKTPSGKHVARYRLAEPQMNLGL